MKAVQWGELYNEFKDASWTRRSSRRGREPDGRRGCHQEEGIYSYVLDGQEKHLNIRAFTEPEARGLRAAEGHLPCLCKHFELEEMEADHITPWHEGGKTRLPTARCSAATTTAGRAASKTTCLAGLADRARLGSADRFPGELGLRLPRSLRQSNCGRGLSARRISLVRVRRMRDHLLILGDCAGLPRPPEPAHGVSGEAHAAGSPARSRGQGFHLRRPEVLRAVDLVV